MPSLDQPPVRLPTLSEADYVHDIAYDHYGTRFAICTSGRRISVFSAPPGGGSTEDADSSSWIETARMDRAHAGPIWRLSWGHPEHGEPLASCSEDRTVNIWSDRSGGPNAAVTKQSGDGMSTGAGTGGVMKLVKRSTLQAEGPIVDVRFAPAHLGLKLATCTADGKARIFESVNALSLTEWTWENLTDLAPTAGTKGEPLSTSAALSWKPVSLDEGNHGGDDAEVLATGGRGGRLAIWTRSKRGWDVTNVEAHAVEEGGVKDVAWCPNLCKPYEIIATCGGGATLWRVDLFVGDAREKGANCKVQVLQVLVDPAERICPIWRCSWNLTGTSLALCPEGSETSTWRSDSSHVWQRDLGPSDEEDYT